MAKALMTDIEVESIASEIAKLFERVRISPCLADYGIDKSKAELIANSAITPGRAENNIVAFSQDNLLTLVKNLFEITAEGRF